MVMIFCEWAHNGGFLIRLSTDSTDFAFSLLFLPCVCAGDTVQHTFTVGARLTRSTHHRPVLLN